MSQFSNQLRTLLETSLMKKDKAFVAQASFDDDFIGFQGHFPDNPVLPGIALVQAVIVICEMGMEIPCSLIRIKDAKFMEPVLPNRQITITVSPSEAVNGTMSVKGTVTKSDKIVSKMALLLTKGTRNP